MADQFSKSQVDRLGERLKKGKIEEADLRMLDQYRRLYTPAYEVVVKAIRGQLLLEPTGRPAKSTTSIVEKLRRESIRLTQIQDIAGCRLIATDIRNQDEVVASLRNLLEDVTTVDRREKPSHGYRAVHLIVRVQKRLIEIQVRTVPQHLWAELSEKLSDIFGQTFKYGGGDEKIREALVGSSVVVCDLENKEKIFIEPPEALRESQRLISELQEEQRQAQAMLFEIQSFLELQSINNEIPDHVLQELIEGRETIDKGTKQLRLAENKLDSLEDERRSLVKQFEDRKQQVSRGAERIWCKAIW